MEVLIPGRAPAMMPQRPPQDHGQNVLREEIVPKAAR
jgi:hypothetical protein